MIVSGFVEPNTKELPLEFAVEMNRFVQLQIGGIRRLIVERIGFRLRARASYVHPHGSRDTLGLDQVSKGGWPELRARRERQPGT